MIKEYREKAGLTQKEFSDIFEIPIDVVKSWDSGRRKPPIWAEKLIVEKLDERANAVTKKEEYEIRNSACNMYDGGWRNTADDLAEMREALGSEHPEYSKGKIENILELYAKVFDECEAKK